MVSDGARIEAIIVGGGPAGLSAALYLGRCRRRVVLFDSGEYRNAVSSAMHGYLTRHGVSPREFRELSREELLQYDGVEIRDEAVAEARRSEQGFTVVTRAGEELSGSRLILATGLVDELPPTPGARELYGKSMFHCPYCDGWEHRDLPLAAYGKGDDDGAEFAWELRQWSKDLVLCTDGPSELSGDWRLRLAKAGIALREERIARFEHEGGMLRNIHFEGGRVLARSALFFNVGAHPRSSLARQLGCRFDDRGGVLTEACCAVGVDGLYVVGDATRDVLQVVFAAAEGARAAMVVNAALLREDARACDIS